MKERIKDKIKEITEFLEFLSQRVPDTLEEYKSNLEKKAICERYVEKVIEAIVDLSFLLIRHLKIEIPAETSDTEIFYILAEKHIISKSLAENMADAKGMRNIIAHEYGKIDDNIVFEAVSCELQKDTDEFIKSVEKAINAE